MTGALELLTELIRFRTVGSGEGAAPRHCAELVEKTGLDSQLLARY
jgi:succinyl-diaminopimelate desuccinylase